MLQVRHSSGCCDTLAQNSSGLSPPGFSRLDPRCMGAGRKKYQNRRPGLNLNDGFQHLLRIPRRIRA
jgi:hypothetical protein